MLFNCIFYCDKVCNGFDDCHDGNISDEHNCRPVSCRPDHIKCPNSNICVHRRALCDGDNDCNDNSDENELFCQQTDCSQGMSITCSHMSIYSATD